MSVAACDMNCSNSLSLLLGEAGSTLYCCYGDESLDSSGNSVGTYLPTFPVFCMPFSSFMMPLSELRFPSNELASGMPAGLLITSTMVALDAGFVFMNSL